MSNHCQFLPSCFPRAPLKSGIGRVLPQLKRITIKFCKEWASCKGVRDFIEQDLIDFAKAHPEVVVYLKPRRHHSPVIISEYLSGDRQYFNAHNKCRDDVNMWLYMFTTRPGHKELRFRKLWYTAYPSIQGVWSPFTNRDPTMNITAFPHPKFSTPHDTEKSATEILKDMFEEQKRNEELNKSLDNNFQIEVQR